MLGWKDIVQNYIIKHSNRIKKTGKTEEFKKIEKLSRREKQCLKLLLEEKTSKESAFILGLSPRTIEFYFGNIKNKLFCWNKQEVLMIAGQFDELGIL